LTGSFEVEAGGNRGVAGGGLTLAGRNPKKLLFFS